MAGAGFWFVKTYTTNDPNIPTVANDQRVFNRNVSYAFSALVGGYGNAGDGLYRFSPVAVPGFVLCDGSVLTSQSYPELYEALTAGGWASAGQVTFALPTQAQIATIIATPPPTPVQVVNDGTVTSGTTPSTPSGGTGGTGGTTGGAVGSGGRPPVIKRQLD